MKKLALSYKDAIDHYFGGMDGLSQMKLPFTCTCGGSSYLKIIEKMPVKMPIMSVNKIFTHIRQVHSERIKK